MGFETVVRPVVLPNIRPRPARAPLPPADDPEKGFCVIRGNGYRQASTSKSVSVSSSQSRPKEIKRRVDVTRVYQKMDDGTVNKQNFVDVEVANKIWMETGAGPNGQRQAAIEEGVLDAIAQGLITPEKTAYWYNRPDEQDNIEIIHRNVIKESGSSE